MSFLYAKIFLFIVALICAAFFAFLETAFTALRLFKIKEFAHKSGRYKKLFDTWEHNPARILITILIASNLADVACSILVADITHAFLGDTTVALAVGVIVATLLILMFGEVLPKTYAKLRYERVLGSCLWSINGLYYFFYPLASVLLRCTDALVHTVEGNRGGEKHDTVSEPEIKFLINYSDQKGLMEASKSEMLQNIFSLGQTLLKEILVPATDMVVLDINSSLEDAMELFSTSRFTRLPVYEGKEDNIIGMIHQKDLFEILYKKLPRTLRDILMPILFEPETKKINQLLSEFLKQRVHMAIVVDEYGEMVGLVTLEDILEEIVGDILDEHEHEKQEIIPLEEGGWMVNARVDLEKLGHTFGIAFEAHDSVTLGGFLSEHLQHLPQKGEQFVYKAYCFHVQRATSRRVHQVLVFKDAFKPVSKFDKMAP